MYSKEMIIEEIKRVAKKLGVKSLKQKDFEENSTIPLNTVKYYMGTWREAVKDAGLKVAGSLDIVDKKELLEDLIRVYNESGETPTQALIKARGNFDLKLYTSRWRSLNDAFLEAKEKFLIKTEKLTKTDEADVIEDDFVGGVEDILKVGESDKEKDDFEVLEAKDEIDINQEIEEIVKEGEPEHVDVDQKVEEIPQTDEPEESEEDKDTAQEPVDFDDISFDHTESEMDEEVEDLPEINEPEDIDDDLDITKESSSLDNFDYKHKKVDTDRDIEDIPKPAEFEIVEDNQHIIEEKVVFNDLKIDQGVQEDMKQKIRFIPETVKPKKIKKKRIITGEPISFRGLRYAPFNKQGVVFLFSMVSHELGFIIEILKPGYPDCEGRRCFDKKENKWEHIEIGFEYQSSDFKEQGHDEDECDLIVCWIHDWEECTMEVLELRSIIQYLDEA